MEPACLFLIFFFHLGNTKSQHPFSTPSHYIFCFSPVGCYAKLGQVCLFVTFFSEWTIFWSFLI
jgi:hypothetical protein